MSRCRSSFFTSSTISYIDYAWACGGNPWMSVNVACCKERASSGVLNIFLWCWRTLSGRPSRIHSCCKAYNGVMRSKGCHMKHCLRKSINLESEHFSTFSSDLCPGWRSLPLELEAAIGLLSFSKNKCLLDDKSRTLAGGSPHISMIYDSWSTSFSPGNSGKPE